MLNIVIAVLVLSLLGLIALRYQAKKRVPVPVKKNEPSAQKKVIKKKAARKSK